MSLCIPCPPRLCPLSSDACTCHKNLTLSEVLWRIRSQDETTEWTIFGSALWEEVKDGRERKEEGRGGRREGRRKGRCNTLYSIRHFTSLEHCVAFKSRKARLYYSVYSKTAHTELPNKHR